MNNLLEKAKTLQKAADEINKFIEGKGRESGIFAWSFFQNKTEFQMHFQDFIHGFGDGILTERDCGMYPYQLSVEKDGMVFFALLSSAEYLEYLENKAQQCDF